MVDVAVAAIKKADPGSVIVKQGDATLIKSALIRSGRPRIEDRDKTLAATEPWKAEGMSRASWYRRRKP